MTHLGPSFLLFALAFLFQSSDADEALLAAARKGDLDGVKAALQKGANIEAKTRHGVTPLYYAASNGHLEIVQLLADKGANVSVSDTFYKFSALGFAIDRNHSDVAVYLLKKGCTSGPASLGSAVSEGLGPVVQAILESDTKPTQDQLNEALRSAEAKKKDDIAAMLRKAGAQELPKPDFQVDAAVLAGYAGTYRSEQIGEAQMVVKDGKLVLMGPGQPLELGAFDNENFQGLQFPQLKVKFNSANGMTTGFTLLQGTQKFEFKRAAAK